MKPRILVTGGAGFIGTNLVHRLLSLGHPVCILDNLSRLHVHRNLSWLLSTHSDLLKVEVGDVRDRQTVRRIVRDVDHVFHLAAQVAVTTSVDAPIADFETNVVGTLNVLEAIRAMPSPPSILYTSTNKVYGALEELPLDTGEKRYIREGTVDDGIDEGCPLSFHSPYGCSKGAAEQYVLDYHRTYGIRSVVFRMSCIYGPHQFGNEDQGWVAHIMSRALAREPVTIYGDGRQVRDILHIDDLVNAMVLAYEKIDSISGKAFNIGGGPQNTISLLELIETLDRLDIKPPISFSRWRIGDQKYYVSNTSRFSSKTGWAPQVSIQKGIRSLYSWLADFQQEVSEQPLVRESA
jgi:CDP-paratose 2-epimerase